MKWWDQMPWSQFSECWVLSQIFHLFKNFPQFVVICTKYQRLNILYRLSYLIIKILWGILEHETQRGEIMAQSHSDEKYFQGLTQVISQICYHDTLPLDEGSWTLLYMLFEDCLRFFFTGSDISEMWVVSFPILLYNCFLKINFWVALDKDIVTKVWFLSTFTYLACSRKSISLFISTSHWMFYSD